MEANSRSVSDRWHIHWGWVSNVGLTICSSLAKEIHRFSETALMRDVIDGFENTFRQSRGRLGILWVLLAISVLDDHSNSSLSVRVHVGEHSWVKYVSYPCLQFHVRSVSLRAILHPPLHILVEPANVSFEGICHRKLLAKYTRMFLLLAGPDSLSKAVMTSEKGIGDVRYESGTHILIREIIDQLLVCQRE